MLDKILKSLSADPNLDDKVKTAQMVGRYINKYPNGAGVDLTAEYLKALAFPDRRKIQDQKDRDIADKFVKYVEDQIEKDRVEQIRRNNAIALSTIYDKTRELRGETDKISQRSWQIEQNLSQKHENLSQRLESLQEENKSLLEKQLERIETGEKSMTSNFSDTVFQLFHEVPIMTEKLETQMKDIENRRVEERRTELEAEMSKPKPVYEQVLIKETGHIITLEK